MARMGQKKILYLSITMDLTQQRFIGNAYEWLSFLRASFFQTVFWSIQESYGNSDDISTL